MLKVDKNDVLSNCVFIILFYYCRGEINLVNQLETKKDSINLTSDLSRCKRMWIPFMFFAYEKFLHPIFSAWSSFFFLTHTLPITFEQCVLDFIIIHEILRRKNDFVWCYVKTYTCGLHNIYIYGVYIYIHTHILLLIVQ